MKITENKKAVCRISLPEQPTPRELFAAEELIYYIKEISGVDLDISGDYQNTIIIGGPARNKAAEDLIGINEFEKMVPGPEGFMIRIEEHALLLAGSSGHPDEQERGTLYAVYEFLEKYLGCSLCAYGKTGVDMGEYIPKKTDIELKPDTYVQESSHVGYRAAILQYGRWVGEPEHLLNERFISWLAKNRFNYIMTWSSVYEGFKKNGMLEEAEKRGILFNVGHHEAITMLLPHNGNEYFSEKYAITHPEYYKLLEDGTRYVVKDGDYSGQLILCMRNEELIAQMVENIIIWSDANPQVGIISLWPYDGIHEQCCCDHCRIHSKSANYTHFVNEIVSRINKRKPNLKIDQISYLDLTECDTENLSSSIIVDEALWHDDIRTVGNPDGRCFADSVYEKNILQWKEAGASVIYYDYLMGAYGCVQLWIPTGDEMQAVCKRFVEKGIYGLGTQMEVYNMWNNIFNFYSYGRTAYNVNLSMEDNLDLFCRIFGRGAEYIKKIIRLGEAIVDGQDRIGKIERDLMMQIDREKVYDLYEKALEAATDVVSRNNIRMMRMVFRYSDLEVNNPRYQGETECHLSTAEDPTGELWYMNQHFDSFVSGNEGFGIAIPVLKRSDVRFEPDKWYLFE